MKKHAIKEAGFFIWYLWSARENNLRLQAKAGFGLSNDSDKDEDDDSYDAKIKT